MSPLNRRRTGRLLAAIAAVYSASLARADAPKPATADDIAAAIKKCGDAKDFKDADFVYVLDEADVYVQTSGLATTESCQVIKLLTPAGIKSQSVQRFEFDPATRHVTVKSVRVHRTKGNIIDEVPLAGLVTQPTPQDIIFWGGKQQLLEVPRLEVGDVLEIRISRVGFNIAYLAGDGENSPGGAVASSETPTELQPPMPGEWYEVTLFAGSQPIVKKRYSVHLPRKMNIQYEVYNGAVKTSRWLTLTDEIYTFTAENMAPLKKEPHGVAEDDVAPKVVLATLADWPSKSRWFHKVNDDQFAADDAVKAKVAELTKGLTSLEEKIAACNHWVADNVRYYGTSRGPCEGFTLHKGAETFRDRGGVCKDKAGMLVTMLRVLGVEAYPALTMAGSRVERVPADQFNHTVTVYRDPAGKFTILDPTWIPLSREMWSSREAEQFLVYGTPQGEELTQAPYYPPSYNALRAKAESTVSPEGDLATTMTMDMAGYPCTYFRRSVFKAPPGELRAAFEAAIGIAPNARLVEFTNTQPDDYSRDSQVALKIASPRYVAGGNGLRLVGLPLLSNPLGKWLIPDLLDKPADGERKTGYRLRATRLVHYEEKLNLPAGWKVEDVPPAKTVESPVAMLKFAAAAEGQSISYTLDFEARQHNVAAEDFPKLREALNALQDLSDLRVACRTADSQGDKHADAGTVKSEVAHD